MIGGDLDAAHRAPSAASLIGAAAVPDLVIVTLASARLPPEKHEVSPANAAFRAAGTSSELVIVLLQPGGRFWVGWLAEGLRPAEVHPAASSTRPSSAIGQPNTAAGSL